MYGAYKYGAMTVAVCDNCHWLQEVRIQAKWPTAFGHIGETLHRLAVTSQNPSVVSITLLFLLRKITFWPWAANLFDAIIFKLSGTIGHLLNLLKSFQPMLSSELHISYSSVYFCYFAFPVLAFLLKIYIYQYQNLFFENIVHLLLYFPSISIATWQSCAALVFY